VVLLWANIGIESSKEKDIMPNSYRDWFVSEKETNNYDNVVYTEGSASDLLWQLEKPVLEEIVKKIKQKTKRVNYLDFACGTGRIISFVEDKVDSATGIDISGAMLSQAAKRVRKATLLCKDITSDVDDIEGQYDLITTFRFILNAESDLRRVAMRQLAKRLKGPQSRLVVNVHGNPLSYKLLLIPYYWCKATMKGNRLKGYMTKQQAVAVITDAGLVVDQVMGMGFIGGRILKFFPRSMALLIERRLVGIHFFQAFGVNQLFICRLRQS
jgi:SAM-dependent methyltransferase